MSMSKWFRTYGYEQVYPDLFVGAYPTDLEDVAVLHRLEVERVLNLVQDAEYAPGERDAVSLAYHRAGIVEERLRLVDFGRLPAERIEEAVAQLLDWLDDDRRVYVHCRAGRQRSAAVAAGTVAVRENVSIERALALVRHRRPTADPLPHQREDLTKWWMDRPLEANPRRVDRRD